MKTVKQLIEKIISEALVDIESNKVKQQFEKEKSKLANQVKKIAKVVYLHNDPSGVYLSFTHNVNGLNYYITFTEDDYEHLEDISEFEVYAVVEDPKDEGSPIDMIGPFSYSSSTDYNKYINKLKVK